MSASGASRAVLTRSSECDEAISQICEQGRAVLAMCVLTVVAQVLDFTRPHDGGRPHMCLGFFSACGLDLVDRHQAMHRRRNSRSVALSVWKRDVVEQFSLALCKISKESLAYTGQLGQLSISQRVGRARSIQAWTFCVSGSASPSSRCQADEWNGAGLCDARRNRATQGQTLKKPSALTV
jgi:hypothetical protein